MQAQHKKEWIIAPRRVLLIIGLLFLLLAAIGAMIGYGRSAERKNIAINKIDESAFVVPTPKADIVAGVVPKLTSACFNPNLDLTADKTKTMRGAVIKLSTPGVIGGFNYGDVTYQWTASAGVLTQDGKTAQIDTRSIEKDSEIRVDVQATGKDGICKAKSSDTVIQVLLPYTPPAVSIEPGEIIPGGMPNLRRPQALLCLGDRIKLRAVSSNERLRYEWQSAAGGISGDGKEAVFNTNGLDPGVHTAMVWARSDEATAFDSIPISVAKCTTEGMQLDACPRQFPLEISQKSNENGILFSVDRDGLLPFAGNYQFNWSTSAGKVYGHGGVAWFERKSAPFDDTFNVQLTISGDQPQCRLQASTIGGEVRTYAAYSIRPTACEFARNSADLSAQCKVILREMAADLSEHAGSRAFIDAYRLPMEIEGFELLRGRAIKQFLITTYQIEPPRILIRSGGISTYLSRDSETIGAQLKFADEKAPAPDGPPIVFFAEDEAGLPDLKFQEEVKGSYPGRMEAGEEEPVSLQFVRKLSALPIPSPTSTVQGGKTTTIQPVIPLPGRDLSVALEEAMGRGYELWIHATLASSQFDIAPKSAELAGWRKLALAGEVQWDWTIKPRSELPLQLIDASVEIEWRPTPGTTGETIKHTLWKETLAIEVDSPLLKKGQIRVATPIFSVAGLALIALGVFPIRRKKDRESDLKIPDLNDSGPFKGTYIPKPDQIFVPPPASPPEWGPPTAGAEPPPPTMAEEVIDIPPPAIPIRAGRPDDETNLEQDVVECSVFAPPATAPAATIMVQIFAHLHEQAEEAERLAREFDEDARRKAVKTLASKIARGSELMFDLRIADWSISDPVQTLTWNGHPESVQFIVDVPPDCKSGNVGGKVTISQNSAPIGHISFIIKVTDPTEAAKAKENTLTGIDAKRYSFVFISYASADRSEVLDRVQMLEAVGIKYFQDLLSLDPGDRWEKKLYENIDKCDLFLLFWSQHAKDSKWVIKEAEYALARKGGDDDAPPEVKPVIIEGPPIVLPPPSLEALHFNDRIIYLSRK